VTIITGTSTLAIQTSAIMGESHPQKIHTIGVYYFILNWGGKREEGKGKSKVITAYHRLEERGVVDVGRGFVPWVQGSLGYFQGVPSLVSFLQYKS
jgi:hypothetical protein